MTPKTHTSADVRKLVVDPDELPPCEPTENGNPDEVLLHMAREDALVKALLVLRYRIEAEIRPTRSSDVAIYGANAAFADACRDYVELLGPRSQG